jgi:hypothetical protein
MATTGQDAWTTLEPRGTLNLVPGVFTEHDLTTRILGLQVGPAGEGQSDHDDDSPTATRSEGPESDDPDNYGEDEDEEEDRNLLAAHQNLKFDYKQLEERNKTIIRQFRDAKIDLKKYKEVSCAPRNYTFIL